jgi:hypothetical protein
MTMQPEGVPEEPPDADAIDAQFQQLQAEARHLEEQVDRLGQMLRQAAMSGDHAAKAWLSEFRQIAIQIKQEQAQMHSLLQAMHALTAYALHQAEAAYASMGWEQESDDGSGEPGGTPGAQTSEGFSVGTVPGQPAGQQTQGMPGQQPPAQAYRGSSADWMTGPVPGPDYGPPGAQQQESKGHSMLRKLASGAGMAAGTLGILHTPRYGGSTSRGGAYGRPSPFQRRGGFFGGQSAARDDAYAEDDASAAARYGGQQGGQLQRFLSGNLGRSVRGRGSWGMRDDTIHRMW